MKRRKFLKNSTAATILPLSIGGFSIKAIKANPLQSLLAKAANASNKVFVVIQMSGGNDGLNMVIALDQYTNLSKARTNVLLPDNKVLSLNGHTDTGLHTAMTGLQSLYNNNLVNIVQAVGYPNPNFSHFRATDIWMSGSDTAEVWTTGWMGRFLDMQYPNFPTGYPNTSMPDPLAIQIGSSTTLASMGPDINMGMAISNPSSFYNLVNGGTDPVPNSNAGKELEFLRLMADQTNQYSSVIKAAATAGKNLSTKYGTGNSLADQLKIVAQLISGGLKTPVYFVNIGGFDTHSAQVDTADHTTGAHATLLGRLSAAIEAFQDDLTLQNLQDRVAGMTFSEFGRRIMSNASGGTDHGAAAPLIVFGTSVQPGIIGKNPTIPDTVTVNDNVPMQYDFRQVYASVFKDWFGLSTAEVTTAMGGKNFDILPIFKSSNAKMERFVDSMSRLKLEEPHPNPAKGSTQISYFSDGGMVEITLFDPLGRKVKTIQKAKVGQGKQTISVDLTGLKAGNYFVQIAIGSRRDSQVIAVQ